MTLMYKPNISATARWTSTLAGAALAAIGYKRSNRMLRLAGLGLVARGASGWCPVTAAVGDGWSDIELTKKHLGGSHGVIVEDAITIYRPVSEVYAYWRNLENLPRFMEHLVGVRPVPGHLAVLGAEAPGQRAAGREPGPGRGRRPELRIRIQALGQAASRDQLIDVHLNG